MVEFSTPEAVKRKYVILGEHLLTQRDKVRFGCDVFAARGYEIHLVSCWAALGRGDVLELEAGAFKNVPEVVVPSSREDLKRFLDTLSATDFILLIVPLSEQTFWLYRALDERGLRYSCLSLGPIPETFFCRLDRPSALFRCLRIKLLDTYSFVGRLVKRLKLVSAIGLPYLRLKPPLFFIRSGAYNLAFSFPAPFLGRSCLIDVESFDVGWCRILETQNVEIPEYKYTVFLDEALSHHPDWEIGGGRPENIAEIYRDLRQTFDALEKDVGLPIVIALHPKAGYTQAEIEEIFGGRRAFCNKTSALVCGADLVLGHASTSLSYAVIYRKPIMFLTNPHIRASRDGVLVDLRASWLGQKPIDMSLVDEPSKGLIKIPLVDEYIYGKFFHNFICARNAKRGPIWEVVLDRFEKLKKTLNH